MRLIDADAFKEYLKNAFEEVKHVYTDGGVFAWRITEDFCRDIDEQPTINVEPELPIKRKCTVCPHCSDCDINDDGTVKTAQPEYTEQDVRDSFNSGYACGMEAAQSERKTGEWIPCSERLPEEKDAGILKKLGTNKRSDYVIATVEVKGERMTVTACTYDGVWDWKMKYAFPDYKAIAWMPLPDPFRPREE